MSVPIHSKVMLFSKKQLVEGRLGGGMVYIFQLIIFSYQLRR
jgi:hypothetical protein